MNDPLLWLDGDPTDGRRPRPHAPRSEAPTEPLPPPPPNIKGPGPFRFRSALAGGLVSAVLVGGGAFALGLNDSDTPAAPAAAAVSPKQAGNVEAIYAAARESVVSIKTGSGSGTGFVVDSDGTIVTNAHVVGTSSSVEVDPDK